MQNFNNNNNCYGYFNNNTNSANNYYPNEYDQYISFHQRNYTGENSYNFEGDYCYNDYNVNSYINVAESTDVSQPQISNLSHWNSSNNLRMDSPNEDQHVKKFHNETTSKIQEKIIPEQSTSCTTVAQNSEIVAELESQTYSDLTVVNMDLGSDNETECSDENQVVKNDDYQCTQKNIGDTKNLSSCNEKKVQTCRKDFPDENQIVKNVVYQCTRKNIGDTKNLSSCNEKKVQTCRKDEVEYTVERCKTLKDPRLASRSSKHEWCSNHDLFCLKWPEKTKTESMKIEESQTALPKTPKESSLPHNDKKRKVQKKWIRTKRAICQYNESKIRKYYKGNIEISNFCCHVMIEAICKKSRNKNDDFLAGIDKNRTYLKVYTPKVSVIEDIIKMEKYYEERKFLSKREHDIKYVLEKNKKYKSDKRVIEKRNENRTKLIHAKEMQNEKNVEGGKRDTSKIAELFGDSSDDETKYEKSGRKSSKHRLSISKESRVKIQKKEQSPRNSKSIRQVIPMKDASSKIKENREIHHATNEFQSTLPEVAQKLPEFQREIHKAECRINEKVHRETHGLVQEKRVEIIEPFIDLTNGTDDFSFSKVTITNITNLDAPLTVKTEPDPEEIILNMKVCGVEVKVEEPKAEVKYAVAMKSELELDESTCEFSGDEFQPIVCSIEEARVVENELFIAQKSSVEIDYQFQVGIPPLPSLSTNETNKEIPSTSSTPQLNFQQTYLKKSSSCTNQANSVEPSTNYKFQNFNSAIPKKTNLKILQNPCMNQGNLKMPNTTLQNSQQAGQNTNNLPVHNYHYGDLSTPLAALSACTNKAIQKMKNSDMTLLKSPNHIRPSPPLVVYSPCTFRTNQVETNANRVASHNFQYDTLNSTLIARPIPSNQTIQTSDNIPSTVVQLSNQMNLDVPKTPVENSNTNYVPKEKYIPNSCDYQRQEFQAAYTKFLTNVGKIIELYVRIHRVYVVGYDEMLSDSNLRNNPFFSAREENEIIKRILNKRQYDLGIQLWKEFDSLPKEFIQRFDYKAFCTFCWNHLKDTCKPITINVFMDFLATLMNAQKNLYMINPIMTELKNKMEVVRRNLHAANSQNLKAPVSSQVNGNYQGQQMLSQQHQVFQQQHQVLTQRNQILPQNQIHVLSQQQVAGKTGYNYASSTRGHQDWNQSNIGRIQQPTVNHYSSTQNPYYSSASQYYHNSLPNQTFIQNSHNISSNRAVPQSSYTPLLKQILVCANPVSTSNTIQSNLPQMMYNPQISDRKNSAPDASCYNMYSGQNSIQAGVQNGTYSHSTYHQRNPRDVTRQENQTSIPPNNHSTNEATRSQIISTNYTNISPQTSYPITNFMQKTTPSNTIQISQGIITAVPNSNVNNQIPNSYTSKTSVQEQQKTFSNSIQEIQISREEVDPSLKEVNTTDILTPESIEVKQECNENEVIDLTSWIDDLKEEDMNMDTGPDDFLRLKVEALDNATSLSSTDSGTESPTLNTEYPDLLYSNRKCICSQEAKYLCICHNVMYCSKSCQAKDWIIHKQKCL